MKKVIAPIALTCALLGLSLSAMAATSLAQAEKQIRQKVARVMPGFEVQSVESSVVDGLYEVQIINGPLLLSTASADYLISGDVFSTGKGELINITEERRKQQRVTQLEAFKNNDLIVFSPSKGSKRWIAVFTDIQCGYCRKFHQDVPELNKMGIEVRYFSYPIFDGSRDKMVDALCAKDSSKALTALKTGGSIPKNQCAEQNIDAQFALARQFGLSGTPAIVLDDGTLLKGYVKPDQLGQQMGL